MTAEQLPPPPPEQAPELPADEWQISEGATVLSGLRQRLLEFRLARSEKKLDELEQDDFVIRSAAADARNIRGFGSEPESPDVTPISRTQKRAARHREKQVEKIRRNQRIAHQVTETHHEDGPILLPPPPTEGLAEGYQQSSGGRDAARWSKNLQKQLRKDAGHVPSFSVSDRAPKSRRKAILKQQNELTDARASMQLLHDRLDRGAEGETMPARLRQKRIERTEKKRDKLERKVRRSQQPPLQRRDFTQATTPSDRRRPPQSLIDFINGIEDDS